jgi:hypothetical protein
MASYTITWNVGALQIVSGQGTRTITVQKSSSSTSSSTLIQASVTQSGTTIVAAQKTVDIGSPHITSISGPSSGSTGSYITFSALPDFPASQGDYQWMTSPSATMDVNRRICYISFPTSGTYAVGVRSISSCFGPGSYTTMTISIGGGYAVSSGTGKLVTVSLAGNAGNAPAPQTSQTVAYTLYSQATGATAARGVMPVQGGTLDFSNLPSGIYILAFDRGNGTPDTYRINLK